MNRYPAFRSGFFSEGAVRAASLPNSLKERMGHLEELLSPDATQDLFVATSSEVILGDRFGPTWLGTDTRFLIVMDLPEAAALRLPAALNLRKPDQRMHIARDPQVVKRILLALFREQSWETIVDAYILEDHVVTVLGDLSIREFPKSRLPKVHRLSDADFGHFELDSSGSYLYWPANDVHLGASQLLQAVDPMHLADVEIRRYGLSKMSSALLALREAHGLKQSQIEGLSERQVRRLENEESRLTADASAKYARAFEVPLNRFLNMLSEQLTALGDGSTVFDSDDEERDGARERLLRLSEN